MKRCYGDSLSLAYCIAEIDVVHDQSCSEISRQIGSNFKSKATKKPIEVIEEKSDSIVMRCLRGYSDLPVKRALERIGYSFELYGHRCLKSFCNQRFPNRKGSSSRKRQ